MCVLCNLHSTTDCGEPYQALFESSVGTSNAATASPSVENALLLQSGYSWATSSLKYTFLNAVPDYYSSLAIERTGFEEFLDDMKASVREILEIIETFTNLSFNEVAPADTQSNNKAGDFADLTFGIYANPSSLVEGHAYYPTDTFSSLPGDVWMSSGQLSAAGSSSGTNNYKVLLHEIGHALGLQHSFDGGLTGDEDTSRFTVMAYRNVGVESASTYQLYDVAALQGLYGVNTAYNFGDTVYVPQTDKVQTIWDAGGIDTFDLSSFTPSQGIGVELDLNSGSFSSVSSVKTSSNFEANNLAIAYNVIIENAIGSGGKDKITGNAVGNAIDARGGDDTIMGGLGADTLTGGAGADRFEGTLAELDGDVIVDLAPGETIVVTQASVSNVSTSISGASVLLRIEATDGSSATLTLETLSDGTEFQIAVTGAASTITYGPEPPDPATPPVDPQPPEPPPPGGPVVGTLASEAMRGTGGTDVMRAGGGDDTVRGLGGDDRIWGEAGDDVMVGGGGADLLRGGAGDDTIRGAAGDDRIIGQSGADVLRGGGGDDVVKGSAGADLLIGQRGNDLVKGGGGADELRGGAGDDTLIGGAGRDLFVFNGADGSDVIRGFRHGQDLIDIRSGATGFADLVVRQEGDDVFIRFARTEIAIENDLASRFDDNDFLFG